MKDGRDGIPAAARTSWPRIILWGAAIAALLVLGKLLHAQAFFHTALAWIQGLGPWGPAIFVALYVVATVLLFPAFVLTLGAGAVYGVMLGSVLVSVGATIGATAAFFIGRYLARDWVARKIEGNPAFKALDEAVGHEGWKIVGLTRLSPALPFVLQNYAYSLTRVTPRDYILASWIGMTPGILMYAYLGSLAGDLAALGATERVRTPAEWALYIAGLAATVAVTVYVTRLARAALKQRMAS